VRLPQARRGDRRVILSSGELPFDDIHRSFIVPEVKVGRTGEWWRHKSRT